MNNNSNFIKALLDEINAVRTNPKEYAQKLLTYEKFFKDKVLSISGEVEVNTSEGYAAFVEAAHHLSQMHPVMPLTLNSGLNNVANAAMEDILKIKNLRGYYLLNQDCYVEKWGFVVGSYNQAVEFGSSIPESIVCQLLADDGDLDRGNRKHLMNPNYRVVGLATAPHNIYKQATVICYARTFYGHEEDIVLSEDHKKEIDNKQQNTEIAYTPKVTYSAEGNKEVLTKDGKSCTKSKEERKSVNKDGFLSYSYSKSSYSTFSNEKTDELPEGCVKLEKDEKIVSEDGKKKKLITTKKVMKDGSVKTETEKIDL
jgi:hypothetical protein